MKRTTLKSSQFRKEREASWRELDALVARMERRSGVALEPSELMRLPTLYRAALSSLSVARAISLDRSLLAYLENLANRAYFQIYGPRASLGEVLGTFFARSWPAVVLRWSSIAIRRATVTSHGRSDCCPCAPSRCALRHARSSVSWTMSSARCRSPPVSRSTNISNGPACSS
jgi:hypothetical protein